MSKTISATPASHAATLDSLLCVGAAIGQHGAGDRVRTCDLNLRRPGVDGLLLSIAHLVGIGEVSIDGGLREAHLAPRVHGELARRRSCRTTAALPEKILSRPLRGGERNPGDGGVRIEAVEARGRDTDDGVPAGSDLDLLPERRLAAAVLRLPQTVRQHGDERARGG